MASLRCFCNLVKLSLKYPLNAGEINVVKYVQTQFYSTSNKTIVSSLCGSNFSYNKFSARKFSISSLRPASNKNEKLSNKSSLGLADELLASKVQNTSDNKNNEGSGTDEAKEKEERERAWRAMKFSFVAFGVMVTSMGSMLIYTWGKYSKLCS